MTLLTGAGDNSMRLSNEPARRQGEGLGAHRAVIHGLDADARKSITTDVWPRYIASVGGFGLAYSQAVTYNDARYYNSGIWASMFIIINAMIDYKSWRECDTRKIL